MNEARGDGIDVCLELPLVLRNFAASCRKDKVKIGYTLNSYGCKYFAKMAGCQVVGEITQKEEEEEEEKQETTEPVPVEPSTEAETSKAKHNDQQVMVTSDEGAIDPFELKEKYFSDSRLVEDVLGGSHDLSIFVIPGTTGKITLAIKNKATGAIHASELTSSTLPSVIPTTLSVPSFWKGLNALSPEAVSFQVKEYPSSMVTLDIGGEKVAIPMADMGDSNVNKEYFEDPFL